MNYNVGKFVIVEAVAAAFTLLRAIFWHKGILEQKLILGYTEKEALDYCLTGGIFGTIDIVLVNTLIIILTIDSLTDKEESIFLLRYSNRKKYLWVRCIRLLVAVFTFNLLHTSIALGTLAMQFSFNLMTSSKMIKFAFWQCMIQFFYAARSGVLYMIFKDMLNNKVIAMGGIMLLHLTFYYIVTDQWLFTLTNLVIEWAPLKDLPIPSGVYIGAIENSAQWWAAGRQIVLTFSTMVVWSILWEKKDVIKLEK